MRVGAAEQAVAGRLSIRVGAVRSRVYTSGILRGQAKDSRITCAVQVRGMVDFRGVLC